MHLAKEYGHLPAVCDPHHVPKTKLTYQQLHQLIHEFAVGLHLLGLRRAPTRPANSRIQSVARPSATRRSQPSVMRTLEGATSRLEVWRTCKKTIFIKDDSRCWLSWFYMVECSTQFMVSCLVPRKNVHMQMPAAKLYCSKRMQRRLCMDMRMSVDDADGARKTRNLGFLAIRGYAHDPHRSLSWCT